MMSAALNDRHAIVEQLIVARADVSTKNIVGCALPRRPVRRRRRSPTVPIAPAPSGRDTALHCAVFLGRTKSAVALLVGGADQTVTNYSG